jgi:outer membrane protein assembly factor BamB
MPEKPAEVAPAAPAANADAPADPAVKPAKPPEVYPPISLRALCYDRNTGKLLHDVEIFKIENPGRIHKKNSHASPTPVIEENRLYLHFGKHGTACITDAGQIVWKTQELKYEHRHGPGGSPVIYEDLLLLSCDGTDVQYVVGLDKNTGKIRWKQDRKGRMAYTTPLLATVDGQVQLISSGGDAVIAYEPTTGKEIWRCAYDGYSLVPRPVIAHGIVFICTGYDNPQVYAVKLGGKGDVTETHVAWKIKKPTMPRNASPLVIGDELYLVNDAGIVSVLDARTGEEHYHERLGGNFSASPLLVDGRIYLLDEDGKCTVIAPGKEYKVLGESQLDGRSLASFSVAGKAFYLRTDHFLYRIENK